MMTFFKTKVLPARATQLIIKSFAKWQKDRCLEMGAALSYYALFSIFPIFLILTSVLGFLLGPDTNVLQRILSAANSSLPPEAFTTLQTTLLRLNQQSIQAGIVGFFLMFISASTVFGVLDRSVDLIWKVTEEQHHASSLLSAMGAFVKNRVVAFGVVISTAALLLLSLVLEIAVKFAVQIILIMEDSISFININALLLADVLQSISSFILVFLAVILLFYYLPSTHVKIRELWPGALLTTSLFTGLQNLVARNIISIGGQYQSYGAIGGVMILMLWLYFTCQIFFLGCEFSYVYIHLFGSRSHEVLEL
ncbi:MAG: YihY/virulence factor BrkB family protein [Synechococcus sp.]